MEILLAEIDDRLAKMHEIIERTISGLPDEALGWSPGREMNSLAVLLTHTFGSERYWIGDVAGEEPSGRVREEEFAVEGGSVAKLIALSQSTLAHSQSVLARLSPSELEKVRAAPQFERERTAGWAILHALEHTALHAGHIEITRQLWDQRPANRESY